MKIIIAIIMFFCIGAFFIISNNNLALKDENQFKQFSAQYYDWMSKLFDNGKSLSGYIIKSDWLPEENLTKKQNK